jgi:hypothetical protein
LEVGGCEPEALDLDGESHLRLQSGNRVDGDQQGMVLVHLVPVGQPELRQQWCAVLLLEIKGPYAMKLG